MKTTLRALTVTLATVVLGLTMGMTANAGGPHFSFDLKIPLPPLPPIPTPFGFVDVNEPLYLYEQEAYVPEYRYAPVYRPRPAYARAYRSGYYLAHRYYDRQVYRDRYYDRHDTHRGRSHDRRYDTGRGYWRGR